MNLKKGKKREHKIIVQMQIMWMRDGSSLREDGGIRVGGDMA